MKLHYTREEARALFQKVKRHKFNIQKDSWRSGKEARTVDGVLFASAREAKRWKELCALERTGQISGLERQPKFPLVWAGDKVGSYTADFIYFETNSSWPTVEDVKGVRTALYRLKKAMIEAEYAIKIREI